MYDKKNLANLETIGELCPDQMEAFMTDWERRSKEGQGFVYAPTVVDVVLRKP